ncbi:MAG TPA: exopolysaccharide biosynthesis polyprenyl glycosylphosphotransferase, partial [Solirubrobacteraceae bacterium]
MAQACFVLLGLAGLLFVITSVTGIPWTVAATILAAALILPLGLEAVLPALSRRRSRESHARIAIIGDAGVARRLRHDLDRGALQYVFVGRIASLGDITSPGSVPVLARLGQLRAALIEHDIQLLILSPTTSREPVFDELVSNCLDLPVQLVELSYFYEAAFGYVPISEMKAVWFQYLLDPSSRFPHPLAKRAIDLAGAVLLGLAALPVCAILVVLVRRDGGSAIFRQTRIGEGGRPFLLYKLRTMRPSSTTTAAWASADDPRVTPIGRFMRRTHLDELPQLLNVLRGEMSLVGPRPEQPEFVERLEREVPFYQRRHLIRPGISGWAQISCGYARSDAGSVWKHCHDLFYLKHRSIGLDLWILAKTVALILRGGLGETEEFTVQAARIGTLAPAQPALADGAPVMVGT